MIKQTLIPAAAALLLTAGVAQAETVEVYLLDMLDNIQEGYCLDIAGGQGPKADPDNGLQAHTCYSPSGEIFVDQGFTYEQFADGTFYMPAFDVCMQAVSQEAGSALDLVACDGSDAQSFVFSSEGTITPAAASHLCVTAGEDTRTGRSQTNQIKSLTLEACDDVLSAYQMWNVRTAE
ncbi:ricin-type beta-trefoil lectin domain protein [Ruegeria sp. 2205SS24-7]|uniref:ricin-type beta-trefoil lectin domain protein n=1 Tax=Ruegeria discodermiae TaxID=3064389 RepID=UPI0027418D88|nr:ricin-type beta-trefoil lectin domain protein [Ruegeria sp. 2205SS24-7]MDP5220908.1 ricin-type beta-trefoil lectin domain protein [Ruegeria sp. 2205SS24-7]